MEPNSEFKLFASFVSLILLAALAFIFGLTAISKYAHPEFNPEQLPICRCDTP